MKRFYKKNKDILQILLILLVWRLYIVAVQSISYMYPLKKGYLGFIPESNFDGSFYINISEYWYRGVDQAFFPLYPILMKILTLPSSIPPAASGIMVSVVSLIIFLFSFKKLIKLDGYEKYATWPLLFVLAFPTAFFLGGVYTESLFLALTLLSFYFTRKGNLKLAVFFACIATATRIVGIFLLPALLFEVYLQLKSKKKKITIKYFVSRVWILFLVPLGLFSYMSFLWYKYADPLLFVHVQPLFGAGRSGGEIVLLPQVLYRYFKILISIPYTDLLWLISVFELSILGIFSFVLFLSFKKNLRKSYILFSICVLFFPTLSGTLSSLPRYALMCFVVFMFLGLIEKKYFKIFLLIISIVIQTFIAVLFYRGYFVS